MDIKFKFGALCDSLEQQLGEQGLLLPNCDYPIIEKMIKSVNFLSIQGISTEAETHRMRERIMKKICALAYVPDPDDIR